MSDIIEINPAQDSDWPVVHNLVSLYIHDMSEFMGWPCLPSGSFEGCQEFFEDWQAKRNKPFIIKVGGELAGFAGVKTGQADASNQEFFILRNFRRRGIGRKVAVRLFEQFRGKWVVQQLALNLTAVRFWRAVVSQYTGGKFTESSGETSPWGEMNTIRFSNG